MISGTTITNNQAAALLNTKGIYIPTRVREVDTPLH
jgi:hypothetical protein